MSAFFDRKPALRYIKKNGYVSYSSLCLYKNGEEPRKFNPIWGIFGTEFHSRWLENKIIKRLSRDEERILKGMLEALRANPVACKLLKGSKVEQKFHQELFGVSVLGYIDILNAWIADLKSTSITSRKKFIESMNFLQAALYLLVTGKKDFYYIGVLKKAPYTVMIFNAADYPARLKAAKVELKQLLTMLKKDLKTIKLTPKELAEQKAKMLKRNGSTRKPSQATPRKLPKKIKARRTPHRVRTQRG